MTDKKVKEWLTPRKSLTSFESSSNSKAFDKVMATPHGIGVEARAALEERGCNKCKQGEEKFVYTSTYVRKDRIYVEVICTTCNEKAKVLMPHISEEDL